MKGFLKKKSPTFGAYTRLYTQKKKTRGGKNYDGDAFGPRSSFADKRSRSGAVAQSEVGGELPDAEAGATAE